MGEADGGCPHETWAAKSSATLTQVRGAAFCRNPVMETKSSGVRHCSPIIGIGIGIGLPTGQKKEPGQCDIIC